MQFQKGFQCRSCQSFLSHPIDLCPVCGDQFYWRVVTKGPLAEASKIAFFQIMEDQVDGNVSRDFLCHGGELWLPYRFWDTNPSGDLLGQFSWMQDLELFQHQTNAQVQAEPQPKESEWDTIPKASVLDLEQMKAAREATSETPPTQEPLPKQQTPEVAPAQTRRPSPILSARKKPSAASARKRQPFFHWSEWFAPVMVLLLLLLLSCSYLSLRYHKNQMKPLRIQEGTTNERTVLP